MNITWTLGPLVSLVAGILILVKPRLNHVRTQDCQSSKDWQSLGRSMFRVFYCHHERQAVSGNPLIEWGGGRGSQAQGEGGLVSLIAAPLQKTIRLRWIAGNERCEIRRLTEIA
jgi:hypothetical protein